MKNRFPRPSPCLDSLVPYEISKGAGISITDKSEYLKLDWNESTVSTSSRVKKTLTSFVEHGWINHYPDTTSRDLNQRLANYVGVGPKDILTYNGSDSALLNLCLAYLTKNDVVAIREPAYSQFHTFVQSVGAKVDSFTAASLTDKGLVEWEEHLRSAPQMAYLINPCNPTGIELTLPEIKQIIKLSPSTLFIIDEAYHEFGDQKSATTITNDHVNVVVVRTFSKAFGMAGLRLGYLIAHQNIINNLQKIRNGKDVNSLAQVAGCTALLDFTHTATHIDDIKKAREWLYTELVSLGYTAHASHGNFLLIKVDNPARVVSGLANMKVLVRDRNALPQLKGYVRVTIGTKPQMERFLQKLILIFKP